MMIGPTAQNAAVGTPKNVRSGSKVNELALSKM